MYSKRQWPFVVDIAVYSSDNVSYTLVNKRLTATVKQTCMLLLLCFVDLPFSLDSPFPSVGRSCYWWYFFSLNVVLIFFKLCSYAWNNNICLLYDTIMEPYKLEDCPRIALFLRTLLIYACKKYFQNNEAKRKLPTIWKFD